MFSFRTTPLAEQLDKSLVQGLVVCLCTPSCYDAGEGRYTWEIFARRGHLKKLITFADGELQSASQASVTFHPDDFIGADAVVVDIQDVGSRYFEPTRCVFQLMRVLNGMGAEVPSLYIVDHLNPAGRIVEGSMPSASKGGAFPKTCHRHGMTLGELCYLYQNEINYKGPLHMISALSQGGGPLLPWAIPPAADIPGLFTCDVYSGAYLWHKTNLNAGEGTSRPYEYFGAPYLENEPVPVPEGVILRPCCFIPSGGRYAGTLCRGYQTLLLPGASYHSLGHTLQLMRYFMGRYSAFELASDFAETLADDTLLAFVNGVGDWPSIRDYLKAEEQKWVRKARKFTLYENNPYRIK